MTILQWMRASLYMFSDLMSDPALDIRFPIRPDLASDLIMVITISISE